jgi:hypothetical protein
MACGFSASKLAWARRSGQLDVGCRTAGKRLFRISFGVIA